MARFLVFILMVLSASHLSAQHGNSLPIYAGLLKIPNIKNPVSSKLEFLGLQRIFEIQGIPYRVINQTDELSSFPTIFTAGSMMDTNLDPNMSNALYNYVEGGGVLISAEKIGKQLYPLFGISHAIPSRKRYRLSFSGTDPALRYINRPQEQTISLGNGEAHFYDKVIWTHGYQLSAEANPLAVFDDKTVGFSTLRYGRGKAYLMGMSYTDMILIPQIGNDFEAQRQYVNSFEPSSDVIMLILRAIYEANTRPYVYLSPIPHAKPTALIITHDVDAQTSFVDSLKYADLERQYGVTSTFFETTKTFVDEMDIDYYNIEANKNAIRTLKREGWDIGSHTVSHARNFADIPEGSLDESLENYQPEKNKTVYGELKVSKELLDRDIPGQRTISFRAGDLAFPRGLIRMLEDSGYLYDSTFSANDVLTAFPFFAFKDRLLGSDVSSIIEIPVTLDDALEFLTESTLNQAVTKWKEVATANMENSGITVLLVHPSDTREKNYKLVAQEQLMKYMLHLDSWMGDLTAFGDFLRSRHQVDFSVFRDQKDQLIIQVNSSHLDPMIGFIVGNIPKGEPSILVQNKKSKELSYRTVKENNFVKVISN